MLLFNKPTAISYISKSGDKIYPVVIDIKEGVKSSETLSFMTADSNTGILSVAFMEGETIYNIDDATVVCDIERPDGTDLSIGAVKVADGVVEVPLGVNGTSQPGMYMFDFKIVRPGSKTIGVPLVSYTVTQSINTDEIVTQDDRLPVLNDLIVKIQNATSDSTQATTECNKATQNSITATNNSIQAIDNVNNAMQSINNAIASGTVDLELKQLRTSLNGTLYPTANDRINQMETHLLEATATTIETESNFTTVDATSNGYFEDVKLEGKTLVNKFNKTSWKSYGNNNTLTMNGDIARLERTVADGNVCYMAVPSQNKLEINTEYTIVIPYYTGNLHQASLYDRGNGFALQVGMINFTGNVGKFRIRNDKLTFSNNIELLFYTGDIVGNYLEISSNILILEGDHTNNPPSYFEGLMSVGQDVEETSVLSVNNGNLAYNAIIEIGDITTKGENGTRTDRERIKGYIEVLPSSNIYTSPCPVNVYEYDKDYNFIGYTINVDNFKTNSNTKYIRCYQGVGYLSEIILAYSSNFKNQINKQDKKEILYFNPTIEAWEKPILREWDSIEKHSDGKYYYHKRSGEVVLNGSETWNKASNTNYFWTTASLGNQINSELINDRFPVIANGWSGEVDCISPHTSNKYIYINKRDIGTVSEFKQWLQANPTTVVYQLAQEEVYECTNIDLMTYSGETNYIINSGAISPKSLLKVHNNISNVVKILQEKVSLLENTFIAGLKSVLSGDMYSLATLLYPEDFEQNDNTEQDIMVIPE